MALLTDSPIYALLGLVAWGDIAELTLYRSHYGPLVIFPKTYPDKPASQLQLTQRAKYVAAAHAWRSLTPAQRAAWKLAARRASLCATGYNLFVSSFTTTDWSNAETIARQTNVQLF